MNVWNGTKKTVRSSPANCSRPKGANEGRSRGEGRVEYSRVSEADGVRDVEHEGEKDDGQEP